MELQVLIITCVLFALCNGQYDFDEPQPPPCNFEQRCSYDTDLVWATNSKKCFVFRNTCLFEKANCKRQNEYKEELKVTTREKCQALCHDTCPRIRKPICGFYNGQYREFASKCLMDHHICKTGKTYVYYYEGRCEDPLKWYLQGRE